MLVAGLLAAAPAAAEEAVKTSDPESEALALEAQQVVNEHCAEAAGKSITKAAVAVARVSDVWARVSTHLELSRKVYLLYWRGVLGQCLDQEERAIEDLRSFVAVRADSALWAGLVQDANSRLRRLEKSQGKSSERTALRLPVLPPPTPRSGGIALGIGLSSAAVATGLLSGWQWQQAKTQVDVMYGEPHPRSSTTGVLSLDELEASMNSHARGSYALTGVTVALGVGSMLSFLFVSTHKGAEGSAAAVPVLVPIPGGAAALWEIRW
jgi:hypothetical protein